jgi:hypothetical protein
MSCALWYTVVLHLVLRCVAETGWDAVVWFPVFAPCSEMAGACTCRVMSMARSEILDPRRRKRYSINRID